MRPVQWLPSSSGSLTEQVFEFTHIIFLQFSVEKAKDRETIKYKVYIFIVKLLHACYPKHAFIFTMANGELTCSRQKMLLKNSVNLLLSIT
jgi:hypothetical protein